MKKYEISCTKFTDTITVDNNNIVIEAMPMLHKFKGQKLEALTYWLEKKFYYCTLRRVE